MQSIEHSSLSTALVVLSSVTAEQNHTAVLRGLCDSMSDELVVCRSLGRRAVVGGRRSVGSSVGRRRSSLRWVVGRSSAVVAPLGRRSVVGGRRSLGRRSVVGGRRSVA